MSAVRRSTVVKSTVKGKYVLQLLLVVTMSLSVLYWEVSNLHLPVQHSTGVMSSVNCSSQHVLPLLLVVIMSLSVQIGNLPCLRFLALAGNQLKEIPSSVCSLPNLQVCTAHCQRCTTGLPRHTISGSSSFVVVAVVAAPPAASAAALAFAVCTDCCCIFCERDTQFRLWLCKHPDAVHQRRTALSGRTLLYMHYHRATDNHLQL